MITKRPTLRLVFLGVFSILLMDCSSDSPTRITESEPATPRTSPQNLLLLLQEAYVNREAADYESLLAESFEFFFCEEDLQIAFKLNRSDEVGIHERMFSASEVEGIELGFNLSAAVEDTTKADPRYPDRFLWTIVMTHVDLKVHATNDQGVLVTHHLDNGVEQFWFRQESWTDPGTGDPIWTLVMWREYMQQKGGPVGLSAVETATWGQIKSLF